MARPTELPDYPQHYVCITSSKIILSYGVSSSVSKKVSSKCYTPHWLSNTYPTIYHSRSWRKENFNVDLYYNQISSKSVQFRKKTCGKTKWHEIPPSTGLRASSHVAQTFIRHAQTLRSPLLKISCLQHGFGRNSFLFNLTYWLNSSYDENFCAFPPLLSSHSKKSFWQFLYTS
jgi:hypothetical protein